MQHMKPYETKRIKLWGHEIACLILILDDLMIFEGFYDYESKNDGILLKEKMRAAEDCVLRGIAGELPRDKMPIGINDVMPRQPIYHDRFARVKLTGKDIFLIYLTLVYRQSDAFQGYHRRTMLKLREKFKKLLPCKADVTYYMMHESSKIREIALNIHQGTL